MTRDVWVAASVLACPLWLASCASDPPPASCDPERGTGCAATEVCEEVLGGAPTCFAPVLVEGRVFDAETDLGIAGARVVALDANGAARSRVVESAADGTYSLPVPAPRDAAGAPMASSVTLRADASGYQTFPTAPRTGIPVELSTGVAMERGRVVVSAATDIALFPLGARGATVRGTVEHDAPGGVLVVATQGGVAVATAISSTDGTFALFDVPAAATVVAGYRAGLRVVPRDVSVSAPETRDVVLQAFDDGLATVSGRVEIVNAPGGLETSVILVLESTFVEDVARGEAPPGLRAAPVSGNWQIAGVAPGRYVVLAAFENDGLVRDPDEGIGGTEIVHLEVPEGGGTVALDMSFKVTGALAVRSPGATMIEEISDAMPTLRWEDDSSEDGYEVRVYDAFGTLVHEDISVPRVTGSADVTYVWTPAAPLEAGMLYQFRAWSWSTDRTRGRVRLSATEDLRGVFVFAP